MPSYEFGFREVIPDQTLPEKWKEITLNTGGTQSTLQDIKVPERAGGYSYTDTSTPVTRNRFIYWRICHDILELVEHSLDVDLLGNHLRVRFQDTPILEGVLVQEMYSNNVVVLVPTVSSVHRLVFPHPDKIFSRGLLGHRSQPSIFAEASLSNLKQQYVINQTSPNAPLPHTAATHLGVNEEATFALSYSTDTILLIKMDYISGMITSNELKHNSIMDRLWTGFVAGQLLRGRPSEEEVPTSMVLHTLGLATYLFTIGRDCRLRMWSCEKGECLIVQDILDTTTENRATLGEGHQSHLLRKATGRDENDLVLGVFLSFASKNLFIVLKPVFDQGRPSVERIFTASDRKGDLVDFWLSPSRLWAMWSTESGETVVCHRNTDQLEGPGRGAWLEVRQEVPPTRHFDPGQQASVDPRQAYLNYIFHPGMFPLAVINRALTIYRRPTSGVAPTLLPEVAASVLRERVAVAVEAEIAGEAQEAELSDDIYLDIAWRSWSRFYSCCVQYYWAGTRPIAFLAGPASPKNPGPLPGCPLGLVRKAQFSLFRPVDEIEHLFEIGTEKCLGASPAIPPVVPDYPVLDDSMVRLIEALLLIERCLDPELKDGLLTEIHHLTPPDVIVDKMLYDLHSDDNEHELLSRDFLLELKELLDREVLLTAAKKLVVICDLGDHPGLGMDLDADDIPPSELSSISSMFSSSLGTNVVAESLHQACNTRFSILRNLLVLLKVVISNLNLTMPEAEVNHNILELIHSDLIPRLTVLIQAYYILNWIGKVPCAPVTATMLEASMQQLAVLNMADRDTAGGSAARLAQRGQRTMTLLSLFLTSRSVGYAHNLMAHGLQALGRLGQEEELSQWHSALLPYTRTIGKLIWPLSSLFVFPEFLLASCQYLLIQEYVRMLSRWCDCNVFTRTFLLGSVLLDNGETEKACDQLLKAVEGVNSEDFLMSRLGQPRVDMCEQDVTPQHRVMLYYLKVTKMLEQMDQSDCVLRVVGEAIKAATHDDPDLPTLHSTRFSHLLKLGRHFEAFHSMMHNPDLSRRRDSLRQLLNALVESGRMELLTSLGLEDLLEDAEAILLAKARSQDLLTSHFYTILHALYISKSNFRKGATVMFEQAFRLQQEAVGVRSLERQARCLLTCANELTLVNEPYRWVLKPKPAAPLHDPFALISLNEGGASPKRNSDGDEIMPSQSTKRQVEIVELSDVRRMYEEVQAKLQLVGPDAPNSTVAEVAHLTTGQLVGVLTSANRFDLALRLASLHELPRAPILEAVAARCVTLTAEEGRAISTADSPAADWLRFNDTAEFSRVEREVSGVGWKYLERLLSRHEEPRRTELHRALVSKLVQLEAFLPQWLVDSYKLRDVGELLRVLLGAGRLEEATMLSCSVYQAGMGDGAQEFGMSAGVQPRLASVCLPHSALEWTVAELEGAVKAGEPPVYREWLARIHKLRARYLATAQDMSNNIKVKIVPRPSNFARAS